MRKLLLFPPPALFLVKRESKARELARHDQAAFRAAASSISRQHIRAPSLLLSIFPPKTLLLVMSKRE